MKSVLAILLCILFSWSDSLPVLAIGMSSSNYQIQWDDLNSGGDTASSTNFLVRDSLGGISGTGTGGVYQDSSGFRAPEGNDTLVIVVKSQESNTQVAYTAIDINAETVSLNDPSSFSVGDYIAVVENVGFSQRVVVGKVTAVNLAGQLTVDAWDGATGTIGASPSGGDDYLYRLGGSTVPFGTVSVGAQNTAVAMTSVLSSVSTGYTVYVQANQTLQRNDGNAITAVTDDTVSVGSEEYGMSVTGTRAVSPDTDMGVTTTQRSIQSRSAATTGGPERVAMTYKLAITANTPPGSYSQSVFYTLTANY